MDATIGTSDMHLFDKDGKIKHYGTPHEIISEFCEVQLALYVKRKEALEAAARAEEEARREGPLRRRRVQRRDQDRKTKKDHLIARLKELGFETIFPTKEASQVDDA